jgi:Peptidase A4 family
MRGSDAPATRRGLTRARNGLWLVAAGSSVALVVAAVSFTSPGTVRAIRVASQQGTVTTVTQSGGGPGGLMAGPGGGTGASAGSSGSAGWSGSTGSSGSTGWSGGGGAASGTGNAANAATSQNWAGYAAAGQPGTFTSVSASWTQPAVTCTAQRTFSSYWAGLDGDGTQTVEQTGTEADCNNGAATYQGWFEMFPNAPFFYNNAVAPGDAMSASVVANGGGAFTLTLSDQTQGWTQTTDQTSATAQLGSAEIIAEAPSDANSVLPLSNFGTVNFSNAAVDTAPLGNANVAGLTMVSAGGVTEATPSAITNGSAFSVTWDSNGAASPAPPGASPSGGHHHHGGGY